VVGPLPLIVDGEEWAPNLVRLSWIPRWRDFAEDVRSIVTTNKHRPTTLAHELLARAHGTTAKAIEQALDRLPAAEPRRITTTDSAVELFEPDDPELLES
jgi:hypothetical protein